MTIKPLSKLLVLFSSFSVLLLLTACGGGGGGGNSSPPPAPIPQPQKVTVTFALQGSPATVGSVQLNVVLPDSFVLDLVANSTNQPTSSALTLLVPGASADFSYTPATAAANGEITAAIIKSDGFPGTANLVQISRTYAAGATLPTADDFIVSVAASDFDGRLFDGNLLPLITEKITIEVQPIP